MVTIDLNTVFSVDQGYGYPNTIVENGKIRGNPLATDDQWHYIVLPTPVLQANQSVLLHVTYEAPSTSASQTSLYSAPSVSQEVWDTGNWFDLSDTVGTLGNGTITYYLSAGIYSFDDAIVNAEPYILIEFYDFDTAKSFKITSLTWEITTAPDPTPRILGSNRWQDASTLVIGRRNGLTNTATFAIQPDEPPVLDATLTLSAWWKLPTDKPYITTSSSTGFPVTQIWERYDNAWIPRDIYYLKINPNREYYIRGLTNETANNGGYTQATVTVFPTGPRYGYRYASFAGSCPNPGASPQTAAVIPIGTSDYVLRTLPTPVVGDTYKMEPNGTQHTGVEGWYKFIADATGMMQLSSARGMLSLFDNQMELVGSRYNSAPTYLYVDVVEGNTYYIRASCANYTTTNVLTTVIVPVSHVFIPFSNPALTTYGTNGSLDSNGVATLDWYGGYPAAPRYGSSYAKELKVDLGSAQVPVDAADDTTAMVADMRVIYKSQMTVVDASGKGPAFAYSNTNGSSRWAWTHDWLWKPDVLRERWISLRAFNSAFDFDPISIINGVGHSQLGDSTYALERYENSNPPQRLDERAIIHTSDSGVRVSFFTLDVPFELESIPGPVVYVGSLLVAKVYLGDTQVDQAYLAN